MKQETKTKAIIYGGNFAAGVVGRLVNFNIGNLVGALIYGIWDTVSHFSERVNHSKYTRLAKAVGGGFYTISSLGDVLGLIDGDMGNLVQLPFDASMAYQLGKDTFNNYARKSIVRDIKQVVDDGKGLVGRLDKK